MRPSRRAISTSSRRAQTSALVARPGAAQPPERIGGLGVGLSPKPDSAPVSVGVSLPGAGAEEIETQITKPLEDTVNTISGIDELRATSSQGNSRGTVKFTG